MSKIVLGFIGDLGSGKGSVCKYLSEKYRFPSYRFSTMLRDILQRIYLENSRENMQRLSTVMRKNFGQDLMSRVIANDVKNDSHEIVAVEGIRRPSDIIDIEKMPGFHLIYITADPRLRWERLVLRNENEGDDKKTYEQFLKDEEAEPEQLIKDLGAKAEYKITNNGTYDEFYKQIDEILINIRHASKD